MTNRMTSFRFTEKLSILNFPALFYYAGHGAARQGLPVTVGISLTILILNTSTNTSTIGTGTH